MFPLARVPFWVPIFDPQPHVEKQAMPLRLLIIWQYPGSLKGWLDKTGQRFAMFMGDEARSTFLKALLVNVSGSCLTT